YETLKVFLGIVFNSPFFNKGLYFDKNISSSDGHVNAVMVPPQNRWKLFFKFLKGRIGFSITDLKDRWFEGRQIRIESQEPLYPQVDGEIASRDGEKVLEFSVLDQQLNLLVPKGAS